MRTVFFALLLIAFFQGNAQDSLSRWDGFAPFRDDRTAVYGDTAFGYIDRSGKLVIPCIWSKTSSFNNGLAAVARKNGIPGKMTWYFIDREGRIAIPGSFDHVLLVDEENWTSAGNAFIEGIAYVERNGHQYAMNPEGKLLFEIGADWKIPFRSGLVVSGREMAKGLRNLKGTIVLPEEYTTVELLGNGLVAARKDNKVSVFPPGTIPTKWYDDYLYRSGSGFHSRSGDGYVEVINNFYHGLMNRRGELLTEVKYSKFGPAGEGLIAFLYKSWGYMDTLGRVRIRPQFERAETFRFGKAEVDQPEKGTRYINTKGEFVAADFSTLPRARSLAEAETYFVNVVTRIANEYPTNAPAGMAGVEGRFELRNGILSGVLWDRSQGTITRTRLTIPLAQIDHPLLDIDLGFLMEQKLAVKEEAVGDGPFRKVESYQLVAIASPGDGELAQRACAELTYALEQLRRFTKK